MLNYLTRQTRGQAGLPRIVCDGKFSKWNSVKDFVANHRCINDYYNLRYDYRVTQSLAPASWYMRYQHQKCTSSLLTEAYKSDGGNLKYLHDLITANSICT